MTRDIGRPPLAAPAADHPTSAALVRDLLRRQHPDLADRPVAHVASGWDNDVYRIGDDLAARLPRIAAAVPLLEHEQRWLPELADRLPVQVPAPVRVGRPDPAFPRPWSVVPWVAGRDARREPLDEGEASRFGGFLAALHHAAPDDAPRNGWRGCPLPTRTEDVLAALDRLSARPGVLPVPAEAVAGAWAAAGVDRDVPETWVHGDLHPKNIIVRSGRLVSVIDWGDVTVGDPATDLAAAWLLFPPAAHHRIWAGYGPISGPTMARAVGWAIFFGVVLLEAGLAGDDPRFGAAGRRALAWACPGAGVGADPAR